MFPHGCFFSKTLSFTYKYRSRSFLFLAMFLAMFLILFRPALFLFLHFVPHCLFFCSYILFRPAPFLFLFLRFLMWIMWVFETSLLWSASLLCLPFSCFVSLSLFRIEFCSKLTLNQYRAEFILDILGATPSAACPHSPEEGFLNGFVCSRLSAHGSWPRVSVFFWNFMLPF